MFILNIMKHYFTLTLLFLISKTVFSEVFFSAKELSNIYVQPSVESVSYTHLTLPTTGSV